MFAEGASGIGAILRLPRCLWSNHKIRVNISHKLTKNSEYIIYQTYIKHGKTVCTSLWMVVHKVTQSSSISRWCLWCEMEIVLDTNMFVYAWNHIIHSKGPNETLHHNSCVIMIHTLHILFIWYQHGLMGKKETIQLNFIDGTGLGLHRLLGHSKQTGLQTYL